MTTFNSLGKDMISQRTLYQQRLLDSHLKSFRRGIVIASLMYNDNVKEVAEDAVRANVPLEEFMEILETCHKRRWIGSLKK